MQADPAARYLDAVLATFARTSGRALPPGTSVVAFGDRSSSNAVAYEMPTHTLVVVGDGARERLRGLDGPALLHGEALAAAMADLGARAVGSGVNLVLPADAALPVDTLPDGWIERWLDPAVDEDAALLDAFVASSSDEDLDEVELDPERPDPAICVLVDPDGRVGAYASGRPFWADASADDIGVLVAPAHRGRGLAAVVVRAYARRRRDAGTQLYRHGSENLASAAVARAVGFVEVHRVCAFDLGS